MAIQSLPFILLVSITLISAQTCTQEYQYSASPDCTDLDKPYCVRQGDDESSISYTCAECLNDCDCDAGKYCSGNRWDNSAGKCIKFEKEGKDCIHMSANALMDGNIKDDFKCADVIRKGNEVKAVEAPGSGADNGGQILSVCSNGKCRACDATQSNPLGWNAYCPSGRKGQRACVAPGKFVGNEGPLWNGPEYYKNPEWVWLAIYFPLLLIGLALLCCILFKKKLPI